MENQEELSAEEGAAEFAAGINGTATETPPTDPEANKPEAPPAPEFVQVTRQEWESLKATAARIDEIAATHANIKDTAYGRLGRLEARLQEMQTGGSGATEEDLAQLASEYPDLAELNVFKKLRAPNAAPALDEAQIAPLVDQRVAKVREEIAQEGERKFEMRLLQRDHPDWRSVVGVTEDGKAIDSPYRSWLATQPAEYQQKVGGTWDADVVGESLVKFKNHAKTEAARAAAAAARTSRIAASVPVKSEGSAPQPTGKSPFQEGLSTG